MGLYEDISIKKERISVIGLGYVGLPLAIELSKKFSVVGFDINEAKLDKYKKGVDITNEVGNQAIQESQIDFTSDQSKIKQCKFHIVAVPTPINSDKTPDLSPVIGASEIVGKNLIKGSIVVFESTVYPGTTEEICIPILEQTSGLKFGTDFKVGYSPERINPGDKVNTLTKITKVVSGSDDEALNIISSVYNAIIDAGVHKAESIKVAEAAKVIENSQRDINIAFMNELAIVFNKMNINTKAVLEAAGTKWNFLKFTPGLVGGHCIGVDPYYFTYKAELLGYHSQIILAGRKINDDMGKYVASNIIKSLIKADKHVKGSRVAILGITFKENCPDVRNTKVIDIINELQEYGVEILVYDPVADKEEVWHEYNISLVERNNLRELDGMVVSVAHSEFTQLEVSYVDTLFKETGDKVLVDIKSILNKNVYEKRGYHYWSL
ncbi:nucleotide sugar dehydrogenase [Paenibacillus sp. 1011MAR3C5]|uniref:nucleotide sugar dehydrogenase n=1 Tax=Paenibacillus sp. 1011MAR3C5 TaxID=1675787 RepID=UPI000E6CEC6D|nr:nucleotide sugar dehydrogenase [Paenibacillus sp. 1011MAR3C5]RJE83619.1 nucleotide sugar dehydrogenase [Paenibacillus sp. 1011MAR3C5]